MARTTGSDLICKALKLEGVKNVFGLAGDHILPLLNTMVDQDFRIIDTRHEQAAVHMADAWSRITEQPGVCMYTTPGFANAIPGLTNAMHTEGAVISIAGCADTHDLGRGAQQEIEQVAMAAPICKGSFMVPDARRIPEFIARAVRLAFSGRRGPVHLTIPIDVQEQSVDENEIVFAKPEEYRPKESVLTSDELVRQAIALLRQAQRPLAIAGCAAGYTLSGEALRRFIETTRVPVVTEEQARGLVSDDHPYVFGFFERGLNRVAGKVRDADVVVLLGRKQDFVIGFCRPPHVSADAKIIQIDPSPLEIGRNRGVAVGIVGDVTSVLEQLTKEASNHTSGKSCRGSMNCVRCAPPNRNGQKNWRGPKLRCTHCSCIKRFNRSCALMIVSCSTAAISATSVGPYCRRSSLNTGSTSRAWACWDRHCPRRSPPKSLTLILA